MNKDDKCWEKFLFKANSTLAAKRGAQSTLSRKLGLDRQDLNRILRNRRTPGAGLAIRLFSEIEALNNARAHYSSEKGDWGTPAWLFAALNRVFKFTLDAAASESDAKCPKYFDKKADGLSQSWAGQRVWLNPPYGQKPPLWCKKALVESRENGALVVLLLASRSSTNWWHDYVLAKGNCVIPLRGRLTFEGAPNCAPFSSVIVVMPPDGQAIPELVGLEMKIENARLKFKSVPFFSI